MSALEAIKKASTCDEAACKPTTHRIVTTVRPTTALDPCSSQPCRHKGTCLPQSDGTFTCICNRLYTDKTCSMHLDPCKSSPCSRGHICVEDAEHPELYRCVKLKVQMKAVPGGTKAKHSKKKKTKKKKQRNKSRKNKKKPIKTGKKVVEVKKVKEVKRLEVEDNMHAQYPGEHRFLFTKAIIAAISGVCVLVALIIGALIVYYLEKYGESKPLTRVFEKKKAPQGKTEAESDIELEPLMSATKIPTIAEADDENGPENTSNNALPSLGQARPRHTRLLERVLTAYNRRPLHTGIGHKVAYSALPTRPASESDSDNDEL